MFLTKHLIIAIRYKSQSVIYLTMYIYGCFSEIGLSVVSGDCAAINALVCFSDIKNF